MATTTTVDGADRRVAAGYAAVVGLLFAPAAVMLTHPRLAGPVPWWQVMAAAAAGAALNVILPLRRDQAGRREKATAAVYAAFWLVPGSWLAWAQSHDVFHHAGRYWLAGLALTGLCATAAYVFALPTGLGLPIHPGAAAAPAPGPGQPAADQLGEVIARVTRGKVVGVTTAGVQDWESGCGWTAALDMPADGSTWETLQPYQGGIAAALDLPKGGGVTVAPDEDRGHRGVLLQVLERDAMAGDMAYPGLDDDGPGGWAGAAGD